MNRIKELRKALNMTQREFGERIGVKPNTIATYESGRNEPIDAVVSLICREFNVNEQWLRTGEGEMFVKLSEDEELATFFGNVLSTTDNTFKKRFISALSKLDDSQWERIEDMIDTLLNDKEKD